MLRMPVRHNAGLQALLAAINADQELLQFYRSANINAVDRGGMNDHGEVHIQIVANAALRLLRLLVEAGITPSIVSNYARELADAEVVVVLAACLHDIGIAIHRHDHEQHSLVLAYPKARQLLAGLYEEPALTVIVAEVLHCIAAHRSDVGCLTLEAGVVKVADALDMTEGRSRIPFEAGQVNIHSVSAMAIKAVSIDKGDERPIRINVLLDSTAGVFQVDELLRRKLQNSTLARLVEVVAQLQTAEGPKVLQVFKL
ncbi:MAG: HD domain-containing protein [Anaerolineae bacterium]|jgi:metal-dependent HD superfamily phosphatase/phosphodiesterase